MVEPITDGLIEQQAIVPLSDVGRRLDQVAAELFSDFSRSRLKLWINQGELLVDDQQQVPKYKLLGGENLILSAELEPEGDWQPENIPLDIVFEDDHIIVINKPANFVVHPAAIRLQNLYAFSYYYQKVRFSLIYECHFLFLTNHMHNLSQF